MMICIPDTDHRPAAIDDMTPSTDHSHPRDEYVIHGIRLHNHCMREPHLCAEYIALDAFNEVDDASNPMVAPIVRLPEIVRV